MSEQLARVVYEESIRAVDGQRELLGPPPPVEELFRNLAV
jgi:hypothetical protein